MAEPLGIALACVSAYSNSVESSLEFVDNMINSERERLVRQVSPLQRSSGNLSRRPACCLHVSDFGTLSGAVHGQP